MEIASLELFVAVVRHGSFAAVARDRNIAPSSVSRSIAGLESEIGVRLLHRTTRRLAPTEAGALYFERVAPLVEEIARAAFAANEVSAMPRGNLRVTASVSYGLTSVVPLLPDFRRAYPELSVELMLNDANLDLVTERIDLALRLGQQADSRLICSKLTDTRYRVCASPGYLAKAGRPSTPDELAAHDCLVFALPGYRSRWIFQDTKGRRSEVPIKSRLVISNALALCDCALAGLGPVLLADWLVAPALAAGELVDLFPDHAATASDFDTAVWVLYPSRSYLPLKVRVLIDFLRSRLAITSALEQDAGPIGC